MTLYLFVYNVNIKFCFTNTARKFIILPFLLAVSYFRLFNSLNVRYMYILVCAIKKIKLKHLIAFCIHRDMAVDDKLIIFLVIMYKILSLITWKFKGLWINLTVETITITSLWRVLSFDF